MNQQVGHWEKITHPYSSSSSGSGCSYTHTVVAGESLYGIGNAYGVSASSMLAANPWVYNRPNYYVYPGDTVCIP
jgi:LysM repeat protein